MIKLIVTDLDGTLLTDDRTLPEDFDEVLDKIRKKDILFCAASGRSWYTIKKLFKNNGEKVFYISDNGAYLTDGKCYEEVNFALTKKQSEAVVSECLKIEGLQVIMCAKDRAYFVSPDSKYLNIINEYYINYEIVDDYRKIEEQILKIAVYDPEGSAVNGYPKIKDKLEKELIAVVSANNWFDIMNKNVNKGVALRKIQAHFGITRAETMAFGDFNNDIEMLKEAEYSFAMANSNDCVKSAANYEAESNNNFGVTKAIKEICVQ
ncbi:MAG: HAD family hydrolase [Clostridium sp.]|nr:HAD family hydrolase [Clostridium sp.]